MALLHFTWGFLYLKGLYRELSHKYQGTGIAKGIVQEEIPAML